MTKLLTAAGCECVDGEAFPNFARHMDSGGPAVTQAVDGPNTSVHQNT